jgi:hypothetical protein
LLQQVEQHACFSGCYSGELEASICLDPVKPLQPIVAVSCRDCLTFKVGVLRSLLPPGSSSDWLAGQLTQHLRGLRGYLFSFGGYHARGPGFWLSAAYYASGGLFLLDGARSRALGTDLDLLLMAFQHGVALPPHPKMLDPHSYSIQVVYVNYAGPLGPVTSRQSLLASPQCQAQPKAGYHRVTLAEFLPISSLLANPAPPPPAAATPPAAAARTQAAPRGKPPSVSAASRVLQAGDICPICRAEVRQRPLLNGTFLGCLC